MKTLRTSLEARGGWNRGQTMVEYAMVVATIAIGVIAAYQVFGADLTAMVGAAAALF